MSIPLDAPAPVDAPAPLVAPELTAPAVLRGLAGFLAFGGSAALSSGQAGLAAGPRLAALGTAALTTPTLIVAHELSGIAAPPGHAVRVVVDTLARTGHLALWLSPVVLFFAAATPAWAGVYALALLGTGAVSLFAAARALSRLDPGKPLPTAVAAGWAALAGAVALHLISATFQAL